MMGVHITQHYHAPIDRLLIEEIRSVGGEVPRRRLASQSMIVPVGFVDLAVRAITSAIEVGKVSVHLEATKSGNVVKTTEVHIYQHGFSYRIERGDNCVMFGDRWDWCAEESVETNLRRFMEEAPAELKERLRWVQMQVDGFVDRLRPYVNPALHDQLLLMDSSDLWELLRRLTRLQLPHTQAIPPEATDPEEVGV